MRTRISPKIASDFTTASLDPRITFTRSTTATRVNSSGLIESVAINAPRFDYNPVTLFCNGLLIEQSRANLATYSDQFENVTWLAFGTKTVTANQAVSPDGTTNADFLNSPTGNGCQKSIVCSANTAYRLSVFAKASVGSDIRLSMQSTGGSGATIASTVAISSGQNYGNGWYRVSLGITTNTGDTTLVFRVTSGNTPGIFIWGAQVEAGAFATSYIPTILTAQTREADVATITGTNFGGFWQAGKGSALVRARPSTVSGTRPLVQFDDATADNIIALRGNATNPELYIRASGSDQAQIDAGTIAADVRYRLAGAWATNDCAASINSGAPVRDGVATIPVVTQARLGSDGTNYLNGHLEAIEYFDDRQRNSALQVLSSQAGRRSVLSPIIKNSIFA